MALNYPEGHKGLVCTIQYALPDVDHKTYYAQAVHIAEKIVEWQNNPSKIPSTVLKRETLSNPTSEWHTPLWTDSSMRFIVTNKQLTDLHTSGYERNPYWGNTVITEIHNQPLIRECKGNKVDHCGMCIHKNVCKYAPSDVCDNDFIDYASEEAKTKFMLDLAMYIDNSDNTFDTHTHGSAVLVADLVNWMMSKGYIP
jgi:hypothetical protein